MNINTFQSLRVKGTTLLFAALSVIAAGTLGNIPVFAEPQMRSIETPLEGTRVIRNQANPGGNGNVVLHCSRCRNDRIQLKVTADSYATVNGQRVPLNQIKPGSRDFMTGFYKTDTRELTRLIITRK